jgi:hypothetical protein
MTVTECSLLLLTAHPTHALLQIAPRMSSVRNGQLATHRTMRIRRDSYREPGEPGQQLSRPASFQ